MSYSNSSRPTAPRTMSPLLLGIVIGLVLGLAIAGALAWFLQKPAGQIKGADKTTPEKNILPPHPAPASGVSESKPRFEFYKVLTDKHDAPTEEGADKSSLGNKASTPAEPAVQEIYFLQAGSFSNAEDADKLKAKLAMSGMEASIQIAIIPDKGTYHRVRLGPYKGAEEMKKARSLLKQNGVDATPMRAQ